MRTKGLFALTLACLFALLLAEPSATPRASSARAPDDCEGDACAQVSVSFDEAKQQYRARNSSADRWVRVTASNLAAAASACLAPGKEEYIAIRSIAGNYHADYSEPRCGATGGAE